MPACAIALVTIAGSCGLANCSGETLTATRTSSGQFARSWQAVRSAHSPIVRDQAGILGDARRTWSGDIQPFVGWFQRIRASKPRDPFGRGIDHRLIIQLQPAVRDRIAQVLLELRRSSACAWRSLA